MTKSSYFLGRTVVACNVSVEGYNIKYNSDQKWDFTSYNIAHSTPGLKPWNAPSDLAGTGSYVEWSSVDSEDSLAAYIGGCGSQLFIPATMHVIDDTDLEEHLSTYHGGGEARASYCSILFAYNADNKLKGIAITNNNSFTETELVVGSFNPMVDMSDFEWHRLDMINDQTHANNYHTVFTLLIEGHNGNSYYLNIRFIWSNNASRPVWTWSCRQEDRIQLNNLEAYGMTTFGVPRLFTNNSSGGGGGGSGVDLETISKIFPAK